MFQVIFITPEGTKIVDAGDGVPLRKALRRAGHPPHNGAASWLNCKGFGTCGTCAVRITGAVEPAEPSGKERARLSLPPHTPDSGLRLACQVRVRGELTVEKWTGFWGQVPPELAPDDAPEGPPS